jgi:hypothetical protein
MLCRPLFGPLFRALDSGLILDDNDVNNDDVENDDVENKDAG